MTTRTIRFWGCWAMDRLWKYVDAVDSGEILTGKYIKLAVARFRRDIARQDDPDYPYRFDPAAAGKVVRFVEALKHIKGELAGQLIRLEPWQVFLIGQLYGWKRKDNGRRRFKRAFLFIARKNGKTLLGSALQIYDLLTEPGAEVYSVATSKEQANISFFNCREFVRKNNDLSELLDLYQYEVRNVPKAGVIKALSSDSGRHDGLNVSFCLADEVAAHRDSSAVNIMRSGMKSRVQPIMLQITTAGYSTSQDNPGFAEYELGKKLLDGTFQDDTFLPLIYELDQGDDWKDHRNYIKANPNLGVSVTLETLIEERNEAEAKPSYQGEFFTKTLNRFLQRISNEQWFSDDAIKSMIQDSPDDDYLRGLPVVGAIDLSKRIDFTAYTLMFWDAEQKKLIAKHRYYIPEEQIEEKMKNDSTLIWYWIREGWITATPGAVVDYDYLIRDVQQDRKKYSKLTSLVFDKWSATEIIKQLTDEMTMIEMDMSTRAMSEPAKAYETSLLKGEIIDPNPVSHWMTSNAQVFVDNNGNIKIRKIDYRSESRRIDSVITSIMTHNQLGEVIRQESRKRHAWGAVEY